MNAAEILRRLAQGESDYFEFFDQDLKWKLPKFEYKTRRYPSRLSNEYLCALCQ
jgi:hypothetical protein